MQSIPSSSATLASSHNVLLCLERNSTSFPLAYDILLERIGKSIYEDAKSVQKETEALEDILMSFLFPNAEVVISDPLSMSSYNSTYIVKNSLVMQNLKLTEFQQELYMKALNEIYDTFESLQIPPLEKPYFQDTTYVNIVQYAFALAKFRSNSIAENLSKEPSCLCLKVLKALECATSSICIDINLEEAVNEVACLIEKMKRVLLWKISFLQWLLQCLPPTAFPALSKILEFQRLIQPQTHSTFSANSHNSASSRRSTLLTPINRASSSVSNASTSSKSSIYDDDIAILEDIVEQISIPQIKQVDSKMFSK